jgi:steroid 5-alpha reductase family enzyme
MWKTVLALLITIVLVPVIAFTLDEPLSTLQGEVLNDLVMVYLVAALLCFAVSSISGNYSQVDKLWSILPMAYVWMTALKSGWEPRLILMALVVTVWGIRLTYNFSRRGGYSIRFWTGEEDYRWAILRARPEFAVKWRWVLFNLLFISLYQMGLILLMTLPVVRSLGGSPLGWADYLLAALILGLVVMETVADQQQWNYHREKRKALSSGGEVPVRYQKGFVHTGLWAKMRHPNYTAEQGIWILFYFFSVSASGNWLNWSVIGAILLVLLFWGSSNFSESISAGKYPGYREYQEKVNRYLPV